MLKSGSMPVVMQKNPTSENQIGAILGRDTIEQGSRSVVVALGLILLFLVIYYRIAGAVSAFALTLNLLLTVPVYALVRRLLAPDSRETGTRSVEVQIVG